MSQGSRPLTLDSSVYIVSGGQHCWVNCRSMLGLAPPPPPPGPRKHQDKVDIHVYEEHTPKCSKTCNSQTNVTPHVQVNMSLTYRFPLLFTFNFFIFSMNALQSCHTQRPTLPDRPMHSKVYETFVKHSSVRLVSFVL